MSQPVFEFFNNKFGLDAEKCQTFVVFLVKGRVSCCVNIIKYLNLQKLFKIENHIINVIFFVC